jgi:hypothetical protein
MSFFNDECYVVTKDYDAGDRDNGGHPEKPLSSKVASFQDSYMPDLAADENVGDGEILWNFVEHWISWKNLVVLSWRFQMLAYSLGIWLLRNRALDRCWQHLSSEPKICPIH